MPSFGPSSEAQLATCDPRLVKVLREAIKYFDFQVVEGFRGKDAQNKAFAKGYSQKPWPLGNHNRQPSSAADCVPFPIDWSGVASNLERMCVLAGVIHTCGIQLGIPIRWGGDWNQDGDTRDEHFRDRPHFELAKP